MTRQAEHGRRMDFVLSALLETHDWKNEPMVLVSSGQAKDRAAGSIRAQRRFSFAQLAGISRIAAARKRGAGAQARGETARPRIQQEALSVSDRLALSHV